MYFSSSSRVKVHGLPKSNIRWKYTANVVFEFYTSNNKAFWTNLIPNSKPFDGNLRRAINKDKGQT